MNKEDKRLLCEEIDRFLATRKHLLGPQPVWRPNGRPDQMDAKWPIEDDTGVSVAHLTFRYNRISTNEPSASLIYKRKKVCRVDVKPPYEYDANPPQAMRLGLPARVFGTHIHLWENNREYVLECLPLNEWEIPIKVQVSQSTQSLNHILPLICNSCRIDFTPEQRDLTPPRKEDLF